MPRDGFAFVDATASASLFTGGAGNDWEGQFRLGIDNQNGNSHTDRWVNVYTDGGDGTDRVVANSGIFTVSRGVHTFYFVGRRYSGSGTARLYAPSLTALVPSATAFTPLIAR